MIQNSNYRRTILLLISAFATLTVAMLTAWNSPATGFEISIYRSTPGLFWVLYAYSICVSIIVLIHLMREKIYPAFLAKILLLLIFLNGLVLTSLHIIRGYFIFNLISDTGTHIGNLNTLLQSGYITSHYPSIYIQTAISQIISNIDVNYIVQHNSVIYYIILILGVYLLARNVCETKPEIYFTTLIVSFYPFGSATYMASASQATYTPYLLALFILPLYIAFVFKMTSTKSLSKTLFITIILLSISILITHILIASFVMIFLICIIIHQGYLLLKKKIEINNIKPTIIILFILSVLYAIWTVIYTQIIKIPVLSFYNLFILGDADAIRLETTKNLASSLFSEQQSLFDILDIIIKQIGIVGIFFLIIILTVPIVYRSYNENGGYANIISLSLFALFMCIAAVFPLITASVSFEMGRPMFCVVLVGIIYSGIYLSNIFVKSKKEKINYHTLQRMKSAIGIVLFISLILLSIISVYASYDTYQPSRQTTHGLVDGMDHYLIYHNPNLDTVQVGFFAPARFAEALYSSTYIRHDAYDNTYKSIEYDSVSNHFNYSMSHKSMGIEYQSITYMAVLQATLDIYNQRRLDNSSLPISFENEDITQLENDLAVNKIYANPEIAYYVIYPK